jgi:hypothetical protein
MLFGPKGSGSGSSGIEYITNGDFEGDTSGWAAYNDVNVVDESVLGSATVDEAVDRITLSGGHTLRDGSTVYYTHTGTEIGGLTSGQEYQVTLFNSSVFELYQNGTIINLTSDGSAGSLHTFTPVLRPQTGSGGTANVTFTRTTTNPLVGIGSGLITKDAADRRGEGASFDFTIDEGYQAKVLRVKMLYEASANFEFNAGTAADPSDVTAWIYDVTNEKLIELTGFCLDGSGSFSSEFQTASDSTSYRLILNISTTNASAWTLKVDEISVAPSDVARGPIITDWVEYTPTGGWTGSVTYTGKWRRIGDSAEIEIGVLASGAPTGTNLNTITMPSGLTIDTDKLSESTFARNVFGTGQGVDTGASLYQLLAVGDTSTANTIRILYDAGSTAGQVTKTAPFTVASGDTFTVKALVPIQGWGSNTVLSSDAGLRSVVFSGTQSSEAATANTTDITFTSEKDSHGGWATNTYTIQESGDYEIRGVAASTVTGTNLQIYKNGSSSKFLAGSTFASGRYVSGSVIMPDLVAGDTLTVRSTETATITNGSFSVNKIQSPQTIGMNEFVGAQYKTLSSTTLTTGTALVHTTKQYDSHGAYNNSTGVFTCPVAGVYNIKQYASYIAAASVNLQIEKNGSDYFGYIVSNTSANIRSQMSVDVPCEAGDTLEIVSGSNGTASATDGVCSFIRIN